MATSRLSPRQILMTAETAVTKWLALLESQRDAAAQALWEQYYTRLVNLARRKLRGVPRRALDEEDVALSAFRSFCQGARQGRFPQLNDREDLWKVLVVITSRKAGRQALTERRQKRGGGKVRGNSVAGDGGPLAPGQGVDPQQLPPDRECELAEQFELLLNRLTEPGWRDVALLKLENWSNEEIAIRLQCSLRTIERRLQAIRELWSEEPSP